MDLLVLPLAHGTTRPVGEWLTATRPVTEGWRALFEKLTEVAAYELTWNDVTSRALDEALSGKLITEVTEAFDRG
ncbi:hypothetical protein [Micromonospora sp. HUAS LYJ1]|uniref:hypothetical protein n=1 Tax=Micromonospora sp. HUAS LYJ1 TaxID=3061626 RepID=UPI0026727E78|nr:hypothetical protein [Micromonospora sp. HUAS LYJ1]WKU05505.1 hypothetical protein Q2K16_00070 [Micromonospora sp. HUAS LYJ1]